MNFRRHRLHTAEHPYYSVWHEGEQIGAVRRRPGTSAGYFGAWVDGTGRVWGDSRRAVADRLLERRQERRAR